MAVLSSERVGTLRSACLMNRSRPCLLWMLLGVLSVGRHQREGHRDATHLVNI